MNSLLVDEGVAESPAFREKEVDVDIAQDCLLGSPLPLLKHFLLLICKGCEHWTEASLSACTAPL